MTAKTLIAAAALALVGTASFAADDVRDFATPSTLTRAEVRAEMARDGGASNDLRAQGESYGNVQPAILAQRSNGTQPGALTRVEVKRDLARSQADGSFAAAGESYGSVTPGVSNRSRAEVRAEAVAAVHKRVNSQYRGM